MKANTLRPNVSKVSVLQPISNSVFNAHEYAPLKLAERTELASSKEQFLQLFDLNVCLYLECKMNRN